MAVSETSNVYVVSKGDCAYKVAKNNLKKSGAKVTEQNIYAEMNRLAKLNGCKDYNDFNKTFFSSVGKSFNIGDTIERTHSTPEQMPQTIQPSAQPTANTKNVTKPNTFAPAKKVLPATRKEETPEVEVKNDSITKYEPIPEYEPTPYKSSCDALNFFTSSPFENKENIKRPATELAVEEAKKYAPIEIAKVGKVKQPFNDPTKALLYKKQQPNKLLSVAQEHLGIQEVTSKEIPYLSAEEKEHTQIHIIGKYGSSNDQWCAHTVSHICEEAGIDIGPHKAQVQQFINKARKDGTYRPIKTNTVTAMNYASERSGRKTQIEKQIKEMKPGDLIVWKSQYAAKLFAGVNIRNASHIGIIEEIRSDGSISVIEGNANEFKIAGNAERYIAKNASECLTGNQDEGDFQEVNTRDGLIRKIYTAENLASFGYSGYIDMQKAIAKL